MFFPVTMIDEFPQTLLNYNFSRKKDRYFLSPYDVELSRHGSQRTVCDIIRSSDFLCGLLNIDRAATLKQMTSTGSLVTIEPCPSATTNEPSTRRTLSCSSSTGNSQSNDPLLTLIEQRLDFKHRCMFYSAGVTSDLCGQFVHMRDKIEQRTNRFVRSLCARCRS
jgi:hypothetical protein